MREVRTAAHWYDSNNDDEKFIKLVDERQGESREEKQFCAHLNKENLKRDTQFERSFILLLCVVHNKKPYQPLLKISYSRNSWLMSRKWRSKKRRSELRYLRVWHFLNPQLMWCTKIHRKKTLDLKIKRKWKFCVYCGENF